MKRIISICLLLMGGCLNQTKLGDTISDDQLTLANKRKAYECTSEAIADSPFGNSSKFPTGNNFDDPFLICTADQFNRIGTSTSYWNKFFIIGADLNFLFIPSDHFNQIGNDEVNFSGGIDGNNKLLHNIRFVLPVADNFGLISYLGAGGVLKRFNIQSARLSSNSSNFGALVGSLLGGTIKDSTIKINQVSGQNKVGIVAGYMNSGTIDNLIIDAGTSVNNLFGTGSSIGGVVGEMDGGTINNVTFSGGTIDISDRDRVGMIVGTANGGTILNVTGTMTGNITGNRYTGGAVGYNKAHLSNIKIKVNDIISSSDSIGGLVGYNENGNITNSSIEMRNLTISSIDGYSIGGFIGHNKSGAHSNNSVKLAAISTSSGYVGGFIGYNESSGTIEKSSVVLSGGITSSSVSDYIGGFIGRNNNSAVAMSLLNNNSVQLVSLTGGNYLGGFIGHNYKGKVTSALVSVSGQINGVQRVGGLIGGNSAGEIYTSKAEVNSLNATTRRVGGLIGENLALSPVQRSFAKTNKIEMDAGTGEVGGLIGYNESNIFRSYAKGNVITTSGNGTGGLIGVATGWISISNSYADFDNNLTSTGNNVGGLVGQSANTSIVNSYFKGRKIFGVSGVGGLVGNLFNSSLKKSFGIFEEVNGEDLVNTDPLIPRVGLSYGQIDYEYELIDSEHVYTLVSALEDNYIDLNAQCSNFTNECNSNLLDRLANMETENLRDHAPIEFACNPSFQTCVCTPLPGQATCIDLIEGYFHVNSNPPMSYWDFTLFWKDEYGKTPSLK